MKVFFIVVFFGYLLTLLGSFFFPASAENLRYTQNQHSLQALIDPPKNSHNRYTWLGADVATSIALSREKYVWVFGDTLLGTTSQQSRRMSTMTHNSIGTTQCRHSICQPIRQLNKMSHAVPVASISLNDIHQYYWPTAGKKLNKKLLLTGYRLADKNDMEILGTTFVLVDNPMTTPPNWQYHTYNILATDKNFNLATATAIQNQWLYIFGASTDSKKKHITVLSRISVKDAEKGHWSHIQYWLGDTHWGNSISSSHILAAINGLPGTSEMSVEHNNYLGWYTIQVPFLSAEVHLYTATRLTGPWTDKGVIYTIPHPCDVKQKVNTNNVFFAYAAKIHPELATHQNDIIFTYNINQFNVQDFLQNIKNKKYSCLYLPQFVAVSVKI